MISSWARGAVDHVSLGLLAADEAVLDAGGFVDALVAVPVAVRNVFQWRLKAVHVVT